MANSDTWAGFTEEQRQRVLRMLGEPEIDEALPDGIVRVTGDDGVEHLPKEEFMPRLERLELAKSLRERLAR